MWFSIWATLNLGKWLLPRPEIASSWFRLAEEILFFPVLILLWLGMIVIVFVLVAVIKKILNINPETEPKTDDKEESRTPKRPSVLFYWFLILFCGGLYLTGLFFIIQDMIIRHFPLDSWLTLLLASMLLGAPTILGILQVRRIQRGGPPERGWTATPKTTSPMVGYIMLGIILSVLISLEIYSSWRTKQFLEIARPASGVVTRWIGHGSGRRNYQTLEVCYSTPDGKTRTLESEHHSNISFLMPNVGQKVDLLYDPNDLSDFRVNQFSEVWSQQIFGFFMLLVLSVAGWIGYLSRKRRR